MALATYVDNALHSLFAGFARQGATDGLVRAADKARDRRDWPGAARNYKAAIASGSARPAVKVQLGHALKEMGDFDSAEGMYREFLRDNPNDADIHLQLGHLSNKRGNPAAALGFYLEAQKLAPQDAEITLHVKMSQRNGGRAETVHKRNKAMALVTARKWQDARVLLQSLVATDGEKDLIGILANVTKETGRLDEAAELYECYLCYAEKRSEPKLKADCHLQLGHLHKIKGDHRAALTHFLTAKKIEREIHGKDSDESDIWREAVACLREIYPCLIFQD